MPMLLAKRLRSGLWANKRLAAFRLAQDGTITVFGLMLFLMMVMMGGLAVDLMRYETKRTTLQNTLDRATLAAASLTQDLDGTAVVNDYFAKAGMTRYLKSVTVRSGLNFREVQADASAATDPYFLYMIGIDSMDALGHSMAEQRINNVEISLVLDVSGSMGGTKLTNLKKAAKGFVDTVLSSDPENRISIALVPYNAEVNLGQPLLQQYNFTHSNRTNDVNCLEIPGSAFNAIGMPLTTALPMASAADWDSSTNKTTSYVAFNDSDYGVPDTSVTFCKRTAGNIVRLPGNNATTLKAQIDGLVAESNTSITLGIKWGLALMDPQARPAFLNLSNAGKIPTYFKNRPFEWTDPESMKVIVLMTDGEHVSHTIVPDAYKAGLSPIYRSTGDGRYSIKHVSNRPGSAGSNQFWVPHLGTWSATAYNSGAGVTQQDWAQVWAVTRQSWVAWQLYARALGTSSSTRTTWYNNMVDAMKDPGDSAPAMDTQLQLSCSQAKAKGVIVYGIAFEAPTAGQTQIRNCSTSAAHYFNASGIQITTAFKAIANNISQLRLTQ